ncbi:hypothetical protein L1889_18145 [Paenalcaligenes niemegkensis]|uniref:hypothetical protein n=1 Tax=Paenalcaligenes niemegkensis TaxID=2895469 RepID=UPI001EE835EE|nr:hypothetical protein [Paenalcaligenes niemegkensis]MCQ9618361.1 hypothetical protein [Paenalcaligenes niemegkensis]
MTAYYDLEMPHEIYYDSVEAVPLKKIIRSLQGLDKSLKGLPYALQSLLSSSIQGLSVKLESVETGSEYIRFWSRLRFKTDKDLDEFIYKFGQEHPRIVRLIDIVFAAFILFVGYKALFQTGQPTTHIEANNSVVVVAGANISGLSEEAFAQTIEKTIQANPELKQAYMDLIAPAKNAPGTSIQFGTDDAPITLTANSIGEMPSKILQISSLQEIDYTNVLLDIRATDLDYRSKGWSAMAGGLEKRLPATLYPHIEPSALTGTIYADVGVLYKPDPADGARLVPTNLIIKKLNLRDQYPSVQVVRSYVENKEYDEASTVDDHKPQPSLF